MKGCTPVATKTELRPLLELTRRVGIDPLLTQASTGNSSVKLDGVLWIKASGKWMADALHEDIFIPLDLEEVVTECLQQDADPAERYPGASLETAMHATLPHRLVLHVHCVNTIAWAVRNDSPIQLERRLEGLHWQWVPYAPSGMPLAREIERAFSAGQDTNIFVLGNHGLVICGEDAEDIEDLLAEIRTRLSIPPRRIHPADYAALMEISRDSPWDLPEDDGLHALGTDAICRAILKKGVLYPCQAIFSGSRSPDLFHSIGCPDPQDQWQDQYCDRPFLIVEGRGVLVRATLAPSDLAMLSGLAQVVRRVNVNTPVSYLTEAEVSEIRGQVAYRYRELSNSSR
jgi:rhamnose utilization protein RhaD (predicted bifunctional aldolase and dehydrogenase)